MHILICNTYESSTFGTIVKNSSQALLEMRIDFLAFYMWDKQTIKYCQPDHFMRVDTEVRVRCLLTDTLKYV